MLVRTMYGIGQSLWSRDRVSMPRFKWMPGTKLNQTNHTMRKYIAEFIGTFFFILTIGCTVIPGLPGIASAVAIGSALMVMVFAGGHISGGHYNPAVTLAVFVRGRFPRKDVIPYWIAQIVAGIAASLVAIFLVGKSGTPMEIQNIPAAFVAEFLFTFALAYVVVNSATSTDTSGNSFYGLAIGMTVMVGTISVGAISGGAFNPAIAIGLAVMKLVSISSIWIHIIADLAGGLVAGIAFKLLNPADSGPVVEFDQQSGTRHVTT